MSENSAYFGQRREERWTPERRWRARAELVARGEQEGMHLPQAGEGGERARRAEPAPGALRHRHAVVGRSESVTGGACDHRCRNIPSDSLPRGEIVLRLAGPGGGSLLEVELLLEEGRARGEERGSRQHRGGRRADRRGHRGVLATVVSLLRGCRRLVLRQRQIGQHSRSSDDVQRAGPGLLPGNRIPPDGGASLPELRRREGGIGWSGHLARTSDREAQQRAGQESVQHEIPPCDLTGG